MSERRDPRTRAKIATGHIAHLAIFVLCCQTLQLPVFKCICFRFTSDPTRVYLHWEGQPELGVLLDLALADVEMAVEPISASELPRGLKWSSARKLVRFVPFDTCTALTSASWQLARVARVFMEGADEFPYSEHARYLASIMLHLFGRDFPAEEMLGQLKLPGRAIGVSAFEDVILPTLSPSTTDNARELIQQIRNDDAREPQPKPRPSNCPLQLHVGDFFYVRSSGELALIVGWTNLGECLIGCAVPDLTGWRDSRTVSVRDDGWVVSIEFIYLIVSHNHCPRLTIQADPL